MVERSKTELSARQMTVFFPFSGENNKKAQNSSFKLLPLFEQELSVSPPTLPSPRHHLYPTRERRNRSNLATTGFEAAKVGSSSDLSIRIQNISFIIFLVLWASPSFHLLTDPNHSVVIDFLREIRPAPQTTQGMSSRQTLCGAYSKISDRPFLLEIFVPFPLLPEGIFESALYRRPARQDSISCGKT